MTDYLSLGFFTVAGVGKASLTVTVDAYKISDNSKVVDNQAGTEVAGGLYKYLYQTDTPDNYAFVFKTADTTVDQQHVAGYVPIQLPRIDAAVSSRAEPGDAMILTSAYDAAKSAGSSEVLASVSNNISVVQDTQVAHGIAIAGIAAKTDNLPDDPADESALEALIAGLPTDADVQTAAAAALSAYDAPTRAEATSDKEAIITEVDANEAKIDAVKAKTDNLPASPAAVGSAMTLTAAYDKAKDDVLTPLAVVDGLADAIKAKTDNLPAAPAATGDAMTLTSDYDKAKDDVLTPLAVIDALIDAIKAKSDNLPSDPADQSALEALIALIPAGVWTYVRRSLSGVSPYITALSPVSQNKDIHLNEGDDYKAADGLCLSWTASGYPSFVGATSVTLVSTLLGTLTGSVVDATNLALDVASADTTGKTGTCNYELKVTLANGDKITPVKGKIYIEPKIA